jgi:dinuclear metal center YbgI/SA1388 family protein
MKIQDIVKAIEEVAPPLFQEGYDNAGLITGDPQWEARGAVLCLDAVEAVVDEAIERGCNLVIAHHPIVFKGLKRLNGRNYVERTIIKAIRHDIAIYAAHTNLDNVFHRGVNEKIAAKLGLEDTRFLDPRPFWEKLLLDVAGPNRSRVQAALSAYPNLLSLPQEHPVVGSGMIGKLPQPMDEMTFLRMVKETMQTGAIRHTRLLGRPVQTVALCGGSGSFLLSQAIAQKADVFITGDFKYHEFFDADGRIVIADIGHYESEQYTVEIFSEILSEKFPNFALHCTKVKTNPVEYLV